MMRALDVPSSCRPAFETSCWARGGVMFTQLKGRSVGAVPQAQRLSLPTPLQMIAIRHDGGHEDGHRDGHNERNFDEFLVPFIEVL
mmetsp:Transcript_18804/g.55148  ORF Transcript_18804/g.55148 Transcript_18804/m.55148 type:complete len:86 (-) Transcript_18804:44-301(-)